MSDPSFIPPLRQPTGFYVCGITGPTIETIYTGQSNGKTVCFRHLQMLWSDPAGVVHVAKVWLPPGLQKPVFTPGTMMTLPVTVSVDPKTMTLMTALRRDPIDELRLVNPHPRDGPG